MRRFHCRSESKSTATTGLAVCINLNGALGITEGNEGNEVRRRCGVSPPFRRVTARVSGSGRSQAMKALLPSLPSLSSVKTTVGFRINRRILALLCGLGMAMTMPVFSADSLQGAAAILKSLRDAPAARDAAKPLSDAEQFRADLTNFVSRSRSQAPEVAAREWLALVDRLEKMSGGAAFQPGRMDQPPPQFMEVLNVLPPPAAWEALGRAIAARPAPAALKDAREFGLRLLGHALNGDREALTKLSSEFEALLLKASKEESMGMLHWYRAFDTALLSWSDDPQAILAGVERELKAVERGRDYGYSSIRLPDLVNIIGEKEATPYLRRALVSKAQNLQIDGKATEQLARTIALEVVNDLKVPRWGLLDSLDAMELYEAMEKKFAAPATPKPTNAADALADMESQGFGNDYEKQRARQ